MELYFKRKTLFWGSKWNLLINSPCFHTGPLMVPGRQDINHEPQRLVILFFKEDMKQVSDKEALCCRFHIDSLMKSQTRTRWRTFRMLRVRFHLITCLPDVPLLSVQRIRFVTFHRTFKGGLKSIHRTFFWNLLWVLRRMFNGILLTDKVKNL